MVTTQDYDNTLTERQIVDGPSREALFDALRLGHEGRKVTFTVAPTHLTGRNLAGGRKFIPGNMAFQVRVWQIGTCGVHDDGNEFWMFKLFDQHATLGSQYIEGQFNVVTRNGFLKPSVS